MKTCDSELVEETPEQLIERLENGISERDSLILERDSLIVKRDATIEKLINELIALRRRLFGRSSERFVPQDPSQLSLAFEGVESLPEEEAVEPEKIEVEYTRTKSSRYAWRSPNPSEEKKLLLSLKTSRKALLRSVKKLPRNFNIPPVKYLYYVPYAPNMHFPLKDASK